MSKSEFKTFRGLLRGAICNRSQAQFASESGISAEHLNRMLNNTVINRPSRVTLVKIASAAKNKITYRMLEDALDREDPVIQAEQSMDDYQKQKLAEAKEDFSLSFEDKAQETLYQLSRLLQTKQQYPVITGSVSDFMDSLLSTLETLDVDNMDIAYDIWMTRDYYGTLVKAPNYTTVELTMYEHPVTVYSRVIFYHEKYQDRIKIHDVRMDMEAIFDLYGCPPSLSEKLSEEDGTGKTFEELLSRPFYMDVRKNRRFSWEQEMNLLDWLKGEKEEYLTSIEGFGFWLPKIPDKFPDFIRRYEKTVVKVMIDAFGVDISSRLRTMLEKEEPDKQVLADLFDLDDYELSDWFFVIAAVMEEETGFPFFPYTNKNRKNMDSLTTCPCVMLEASDIQDIQIRRETLLDITCSFAKQLGLERFGDILFTTMKERAKNRTYTVLYTDDDTEDEELDRKESKPFEPGKTMPETSGIYTVWLKDGREMQLMWIEKLQNWVGYHRDWTTQVAEYCIDPEEDR